MRDHAELPHNGDDPEENSEAFVAHVLAYHLAQPEALSIAAIAAHFAVAPAAIVDAVSYSDNMFLDGDEDNLSECFIYHEDGQ